MVCVLSFSSCVGERWYLYLIFVATFATCSLSVLPNDVRASTTTESLSLANELENCCIFDPPAITNCSWKGVNNSVRHCEIKKHNDGGLLMQCGIDNYTPPKYNQYPMAPEDLDARAFTVKCLPKNLSDTCSKYHNQYFNGLNITVKLSPYTAIFTQGLLISVFGLTVGSLHERLRFCRTFEFKSSPEHDVIRDGHFFYYDGFHWLVPGTTYQVTVRALPIDNDHNPIKTKAFTLPSCSEVPESYYCKKAAFWQPRLLDVNPDIQTVNVTFDLAPETYQIDKYCVTLKNAKNNETEQTKNVVPDSEHVIKRLMDGTNTSCISTTLGGGTKPGNYVVQLQPQPSSQRVCVNAHNFPTTCKKTISSVFYLAGPTQTLETEVTVGETPTADTPHATSPMATGDNRMWLPIVLGCTAGIMALALLFTMIHRSQKQEQSESSSKCIWQIPVTMSGNYDSAELSQGNLGKGTPVLSEEEFKLQKKEGEDRNETRDNVTTERTQTAGRDFLEMEPLLMQRDERQLHHLPGNSFQSKSCSSLGYTAEFMEVMYGGQPVMRSITSLGTVDASVYRGSQNRLHRTNSKPDLVNLWLEKCPMLSSENQGKRLANSCPDMKTLGDAARMDSN